MFAAVIGFAAGVLSFAALSGWGLVTPIATMLALIIGFVVGVIGLNGWMSVSGAATPFEFRLTRRVWAGIPEPFAAEG